MDNENQLSFVAEHPKPKKNKAGRPHIPILCEDIGPLDKKLPHRQIDLRSVMYWLDLGATAEEIAGSFLVSVDTLNRRLHEHFGFGFAELKTKCCGSAKLKLRENQLNLSEKNANMAIWLGKVWLGQHDKDSESNTFSILANFINAISNKSKDFVEKNNDQEIILNGLDHKED